MLATSESMQTCNQSMLEPKLRQLLNWYPETPITKLRMFNFLPRTRNLLSPSRQDLKLKSLSSTRFLVGSNKNPRRLLQNLRSQKRNLRIKRLERMKWLSQDFQRVKKRITVQSLLYCAYAHFNRMKSQSLKEANRATWQPAILSS